MADLAIRVTFVARVPGILKNFESPLELLARDGHHVEVVLERGAERLPGQRAFIDRLAAEHPNVTITELAKRKRTRSGELGKRIRLALDHLHYQRPAFDDAPDFRRRAAESAPEFARRLPRSDLVADALRALERALPTDRTLDAHLAEHRPDVLVVSPLIWFGGAPQSDWIRSARRAGIPTAAAIYSWDNLSSKGAMSEIPDAVLVWNDIQRREAVELHGVPRARVIPTGAQNWDFWFDRAPARDRRAFCERVGLDPDRPYVLYLESSGYVGGERELLPEWRAALPAALQVLVRPHPQVHEPAWPRLDGVAVWPREPTEPLSQEARDDFFDSVHHCAAAVGVNTSAFIEAALLDKPSFSLTLPRFRKGTADTVHFHYLRADNGGPTRTAETLDEHVRQLEEALQHNGPDPAARRFVERFVRPNGRDVAAGPRFVAALEQLAARRL